MLPCRPRTDDISNTLPRTFSLDPIGADRLGHEPDAADIGIHHRLPILVVQFLDEAGLVEARGDDELIDLAECGERRR